MNVNLFVKYVQTSLERVRIMKIIYIAEDGKEFDDELECEHYEWLLNHPHINEIQCYGKRGVKLKDLLLEETYCRVTKIIIKSEEELKEFHDLAIYTGFMCYKYITDIGTWIFDDKAEGFVKSE